MKTKKAKQSKSKKTIRKSEASKLDRFGFDVKSNQGIVNAALLKRKEASPAELAELTGLAYRRCRYQCRVLVKAKLAKKTKDGNYKLN